MTSRQPPSPRTSQPTNPTPRASQRDDGPGSNQPLEIEAGKLIEALAWMLAEKTIERAKSKSR
ncbi:MAG: hypothetical protein ACXWF6_19410 [Usitatibacter sp.]